MQTLPMIFTSQDTAYVIPDYPYGFVLRCQKRVWIEYKAKKGYRLVEQTSNPRKEIRHDCTACHGSGIFTLVDEAYACQKCQGKGTWYTQTWNSPKASTYQFLLVLTLDEKDHIGIDSLSQYSSSAADVEAFEEKHAVALEGKREQATLVYAHAIAQAIEARRKKAAQDTP